LSSDLDPVSENNHGKPGSSSAGSKRGLLYLVDLTLADSFGPVCIVIKSISGPLTSRGGWKYRKMSIQDTSMEAETLVSEAIFQDWKFKPGDHAVCEMRSQGVDGEGKLTLFFNTFVGPFEVSKLLYSMSEELKKVEAAKGSRMKPAETVYQLSAREAKSLLILIRLWIDEGKPQHYTKWCQMHQIVATNLYYMGLVDRTGSMSGFYYPTKEAIEFFEGKRLVAKKRVFTRGKDGQHVLRDEEGERKSFDEYLNDHSDRDSALKEYHEALDFHRRKIKLENA
jgi:hypothetical protein